VASQGSAAKLRFKPRERNKPQIFGACV